MEKVLFGCESNNCAAYCGYHHCSMTVKQIRAKECLRKQCWYLKKNDHPYWMQREKIKEKKKMAKDNITIAVEKGYVK